MKLMFGTTVLEDDWILCEHGVVDGDELTLVPIHGPCGHFHSGDVRLLDDTGEIDTSFV